ncbi:MAG TPA: DUF983 domain-containing protein [Gelidibacter sp.]|uniref:DUF983 domain-containing protein n=1 Tax=Gelidibacter sp. TaxID=2018083 RepID=UPI002C31235B|nr:DUF983 domain-containing protein [Gelidibacter sp.]HXJ97711.1 DUF983 domain-containing protein [Gelidibacter sp.]
MIKKGTKLYSILTDTCPKCNMESMYVNPNPYNLRDTLKVKEKCSHCQTKYRLEPSFFFGSMYVSYGVGIAFAVAAFIISYFIFSSSLNTAFIAIIATLVVFMPFIMRISRTIWVNIFIHVDKNLVDKQVHQ